MAAAKKNVLMIMVDQHHARCFGHMGNPDVKTPNLDRLAAGGVRFDNCFAQHGTCIPSRTSWLTGQYCHTHGVFGSDTDGIPASLLSLPAYLKNFGYGTALIGKKHLPGWPTHGFDYERLCYHADAPFRAHDYYQYLKKHDLHHLYDDLGDVEKFCLSDLPAVPVEHSLEVWTGREATKYLELQNKDKPFFAQVSFERPHPPLTVPQGCPFIYDPAKITLPENQKEKIPGGTPFYFNRNVELKWCTSVSGEETLREALCAYYSLISLIDREIGLIMDKLDELALRENTVVIFCSDHGDYAGEYARMAKGWSYDAILRVPLIWNMPGEIPSGQVKQGLVEQVDFFPTICDLLGITTPRCVQGQSLLPLLKSDADSERDAVFSEYLGVKTVRTRLYKLNYTFDGTDELGELFSLEDDPREYDNLFATEEYADIREKLLRKLLNWHIQTQQPFNSPRNDEHLPPSRWFARG
jgi:arylsulfatase A-like enzyme